MSLFRRASKRRLANGEMDRRSTRVQGLSESIWPRINRMVAQVGAECNLGQGFPDFPAPEFVKQGAIQAIKSDENQYSRPLGNPVLVKELSATFSPLFQHDVDAMAEVMVTVGASEALYSTFHSLISPGDELIIVAPYFDIYGPAVAMAGGKIRCLPLRPPADPAAADDIANWTIVQSELEGLVNKHTKAMLLNTPHNPTGKVFTRAELEMIASVATKHDFVVIADEVYEWLTYDDVRHVRIASLPGMWSRTLTIGSAGKTWGATGWKIGWIIGPAALVSAAFLIRQVITFAVATPLQLGVAAAFRAVRQGDQASYWTEYRAMFQAKRDAIVKTLRDAGLRAVMPSGTYFVLVDVSRLFDRIKPADGESLNFAAARWLLHETGIATIPTEAFYPPDMAPLYQAYLRVSFSKSDKVLDMARVLLAKHASKLA